MNLLTMVALAVLVPGAGGDSEYADDVWVRVTSHHVEILTADEATEAVQKREEGMLVKCKSLKISVTSRKYRPDEMLTAENLPMKLKSRIIECLDCSSFTSAGMNGTAHSVVFNQGKGIVTLTGDDATPVQLTIHSNGNGEQKIVSQSMQITLPSSKLRTPIDRIRPTPDPIGGGPTRSGLFQDIASPSRDEPTRDSETEKPNFPLTDKDF